MPINGTLQPHILTPASSLPPAPLTGIDLLAYSLMLSAVILVLAVLVYWWRPILRSPATLWRLVRGYWQWASTPIPRPRGIIWPFVGLSITVVMALGAMWVDDQRGRAASQADYRHAWLENVARAAQTDPEALKVLREQCQGDDAPACKNPTKDWAPRRYRTHLAEAGELHGDCEREMAPYGGTRAQVEICVSLYDAMIAAMDDPEVRDAVIATIPPSYRD